MLKVLSELGIDAETDERVVEVLNKIDMLTAESLERLQSQGDRHPEILPISALTGAGLDHLLGVIDAKLASGRSIVTMDVDLADGGALAWLYRMGEVLERQDEGSVAHLKVGLDPAVLARFETAYPYRPH